MALDAVGFVTRAFSTALDVFVTLMEKTGLTPFYLSMLTVLALIVYLLGPLLSPMSSDTARQSKSTRKGDSNG